MFYDNVVQELGVFPAFDIDNEHSPMVEQDEYVLMNDKGEDIAFTGVKIGGVSSSGSSKTDGRWTDLDCYKTQSGKWVVHEQKFSNREGEVTRCRVFIAESDAELVSFGVAHGEKSLINSTSTVFPNR